ncbi:hypothetical protein CAUPRSCDRAFT_12640 [Caulochytrium protostelioides]|uniref:Uncharacterized protein n=1 Tax=Caulochytrium protostelioides TaxID=1555241 RepID=A0A4P9WUC8_9FUNG|nr:hypothetical protein CAUPRSCDRAFT_12640 [Caulochytrium protostelioides]
MAISRGLLRLKAKANRAASKKALNVFVAAVVAIRTGNVLRRRPSASAPLLTKSIPGRRLGCRACPAQSGQSSSYAFTTRCLGVSISILIRFALFCLVPAYMASVWLFLMAVPYG